MYQSKFPAILFIPSKLALMLTMWKLKYVQFLLEYYSKSLISTFCFFIKGKHFFQANNRRSSAAAPPSTPPFRGRGVSTTPARPASCRPSATYSASRTAVTTRTSLPVRYFQYLSLVPFSSLQAMDGFESFYFKNSIYQKWKWLLFFKRIVLRAINLLCLTK